MKVALCARIGGNTLSSVDFEKGALHECTLDSRYLGTRERLLVYTPPRYSLLYSYPVLYVQDGEDYLSLGRLASQIDQLLSQKEISPLIVVFLPVDKEKRFERYYPGGTVHLAYKRFVSEEVVPYIDAHYATHPLGSARTLLGESLGGVASLSIAMTFPHTFGQVASQSGAFDEKQLEAVRESTSVGQLSIYLEVGTEETAMKTSRGTLNLVALNEQMRDLLNKKAATLRYETFAGDHTWGYWQANLPQILQHFFK